MQLGTEQKRPKFVGIGQKIVSADPEDVLCAANLGSCLGVAAFDPQSRVGGVIHCLLPLSKTDPAKAAENPAMYVDTGIPAFLEELFSRGARKENLRIWAIGCAQMSTGSDYFETGKKNHTVFRKLLWKNGLLTAAEDVGGQVSRTLTLNIQSGKAFLKVNGTTTEL